MALDIIIPAYNAHETIDLTLSSIAIQTAVDKITVTIVNDSGKDYNDIVKKYSNLKINEITTEQNGGSGVARQHGIDNTKNDLILFMDADDTLMDVLSVQKMLDKIERKHVVLIGGFLEQLKNGTYKNHPSDWVWMHAKIYRRSFLTKHNIRFNDTRANEDLGFNMLVRLQAKPHQVCYYKDTFYVWRYQPNSITRSNNADYTFYEGALGVMDNKQTVLEQLGIDNERTRIEAISAFIDFHFMVQQTDIHRPNKQEWVQELFERTKKFYFDIAKHAIEQTSTDDVRAVYRERFGVFNLMPTVTLSEFINMLEGKK